MCVVPRGVSRPTPTTNENELPTLRPLLGPTYKTLGLRFQARHPTGVDSLCKWDLEIVTNLGFLFAASELSALGARKRSTTSCS